MNRIVQTTFRVFILPVLYCIVLLPSKQVEAQCVFHNKILASDNPFGACPITTDTIFILDTFEIDVNYEPMLAGFPFEGVIIVDGGILYWSHNSFFRLGASACIRLINGGHIYPENILDPGCNASKALYFDTFNYANCNGENALHTFSEVNAAGCANCCNPILNNDDNFGDTEPISLNVVGIPNPSMGDFILKANGQFVIKSIEIVDLAGHICAKFQNLNASQFTVKHNNLAPGVYFARVLFKEGLVTKKIVLH